MIRGFSAHLNSLYGDLGEIGRCVAAANDGFRCIEMWAPPTPDVAGPMIEQLEKLDLSVASVNTPPGTAPDDFGLLGDPAQIEWWRDKFSGTLEFARAAHSGAINVLAGGRLPTVARHAQWRCLLDNLYWALGQLGNDDPALLLEPLNAVDRGFPLLQDTSDVLAVISELGNPPALRLLFDAYHLFQQEDDLIRTLHLVVGGIGHVQLADYPGRGEPGTGRIPIHRFLSELVAAGYGGWVGLEYFPSDAGTGLDWLQDFAEFDHRVLPRVAS